MAAPFDRQQAETEMLEILRDSHTASPQGTGLRSVGPATRLLSMGLWSYVSEYFPEDLVVTVGAGTRLSYLNEMLAPQQQWLPLTPIDGGDDSIGGAISAGIEGWHRAAFGSVRDRILGLRVVTPAYGPIFVGAKVVKSVAGYNLPRLFCGTRGALGVITEVTLKVSPAPALSATWQASVSPALLDQAIQRYQAIPRWAALGIVQERGQMRLYGVWHGHPEDLKTIEEELGPAERIPHPALPVSTVQGRMVVAGAVPPSRVFDLLREWPSARALQIDLHSGTFFGALDAADAWGRLRDWIAAVSGAVRVLRDSDRELTWRPSSDPLWCRIKQYYDPDGCLSNLGEVVP